MSCPRPLLGYVPTDGPPQSFEATITNAIIFAHRMVPAAGAETLLCMGYLTQLKQSVNLVFPTDMITERMREINIFMGRDVAMTITVRGSIESVKSVPTRAPPIRLPRVTMNVSAIIDLARFYTPSHEALSLATITPAMPGTVEEEQQPTSKSKKKKKKKNGQTTAVPQAPEESSGQAKKRKTEESNEEQLKEAEASNLEPTAPLAEAKPTSSPNHSTSNTPMNPEQK